MITIGGVPEHFNFPWHYAIKNGFFNELNLNWIDVPGGSGAMCRMLDNNELDLALVLTEGVVKHIAAGSDIKIIQQYVKSPLIWGVHCSNSFAQERADDLSNARFARSRKGSGSHLMAYVHAEQNNYTISEDNFVDVGTIDGALEAFESGTADILLWERFMTQPHVDAGKTRRIGECVSPWPCFVLVATPEAIDQYEQELQLISKKIIDASTAVMNQPDSVLNIAQFYALDPEQVKQWFTMTEWQTSPWISSRMLENVVNTLHRTGIISHKPTAEQLCYDKALLY